MKTQAIVKHFFLSFSLLNVNKKKRMKKEARWREKIRESDQSGGDNENESQAAGAAMGEVRGFFPLSLSLSLSVDF